jgi:hypothetical protein
MAKIRFGYSDDFTAKNNKIGINTTIAQENVDVVGVVKGKDLRVTGVSSQTGYEGFLRADHQIAENTTLSFDQGPVSSLSGEIIVGTGQTVTINTVQDNLLGPELITNGNFDSDVSGWTAGTNTAVALDGGRIKITNSTTVYGSAYQDITVVPGETYVINVHYAGGTGSGNYHVGDTSTSNKYLSAVSGKKAFTPESSIARVVLNVGGNTSGHYVLFDSITVKKENNVSDKTTRAGGSQIECMKVYNTFTPPSGGTNERPYKPKPGELYYNYDLKTIEFHDGYGWRQVDYTTQSGRALFGGGTSPGPSTRVDWIETLQISTLGNTQDFGDLTQHREALGGGASSVRGVFSGGLQSAPLNRDEIDYVTIASSGNALDFGNVTDSGRRVQNTVSSSTRGVNLGGYKDPISQNVNIMDYIEIATTGNALDFGDITTKRRGGGSCSSPTRGIYAGGFSSVVEEIIEFLTIASKGNTTRFGELSFRGYGQFGVSNTVRGIMAGGNQDGSATGHRTEVSYITIASEGNAIYFGDLTVSREGGGTGASNSIRGVFTGGSNPSRLNVIDYIAISTGGNALDFGDLSAGIRKGHAGLSDSHGGLGGF